MFGDLASRLVEVMKSSRNSPPAEVSDGVSDQLRGTSTTSCAAPGTASGRSTAGRASASTSAEAEHGQRLAVVGTHEVAHLGAGQGVVAEIVIARDEGVPQPSLGAAGDGLDAQRAHRLQRCGGLEQRRRVGFGRRRDGFPRAGALARRGQCDDAFAVHAQQRHPRTHVLEPPIGLAPVEAFAHHPRQRGPVQRRVVLGDKGADEHELGVGEDPGAVAPGVGHGPSGWTG